MSDVYSTLEEATAALASTAERAAILIRTESAKAKEEASRTREEAARTRREIDDLRGEVKTAKAEFAGIRESMLKQDDEKERVRRSAGWAWSAVGVMAACMMLAIGWTATQLTRGQTIVGSLNNELAQARASLQQRDTQLASMRQEIESARIAQARAEVELEVMYETPPIAEKPVSTPPKPAGTPISTTEDVDPLMPR